MCAGGDPGGRDADLVAAAERCGAAVVELGVEAFASITERRPDGLLAVVRRLSTALDALDLPPEPLVAAAVSIERPGTRSDRADSLRRRRRCADRRRPAHGPGTDPARARLRSPAPAPAG